MENYQPPVFHSVGDVASRDGGEYAVIEDGRKPRYGHFVISHKIQIAPSVSTALRGQRRLD